MWFLQVAIKKDNGKTLMVPAFQSLETIAGEVVPTLCLLFCIFFLVLEMRLTNCD